MFNSMNASITSHNMLRSSNITTGDINSAQPSSLTVLYTVVIFFSGCLGCVFPHSYLLFKQDTNSYKAPLSIDTFTQTFCGFRVRLDACLNLFASGVFLSIGFVHLLGDALQFAFDDAFRLATNTTKLNEISSSISSAVPMILITTVSGYVVLFLLQYHLSLLIAGSVHPHLRDSHFSSFASPSSTVTSNSPSTALNLDLPVQPHSDLLLPESRCEPKNASGSKCVPGFVALVFLSVHSFIAGLGLGFLTGSQAVVFFLAIIAHKTIAAFVLWLKLVQVNQEVANERTTLSFLFSRYAILGWLFLFCCTTPSGILTSVALQNQVDATSFKYLYAFISGSFIYFSSEELQHEISEGEKDELVVPLICYMVGLILMSSVGLIV